MESGGVAVDVVVDIEVEAVFVIVFVVEVEVGGDEEGAFRGEVEARRG
jgi:hypothetical protein